MKKKVYIRPTMKTMVTDLSQVICASNEVNIIIDNNDDEENPIFETPSAKSFWDDDCSSEYEEQGICQHYEPLSF